MEEPGHHGSLEEATAAPFALLERNWRRVASTHTLQDLLEADKPAVVEQSISWRRLLLGLALVLTGAASLGLCAFAMLVAPHLPPGAGWAVEALAADRYYHLLVPLTVPVTILAIGVNWFSMKIFKHNS